MPQLLLHYGPASAQCMELQPPNRRAVLRYVGHTWAFKWPVLAPAGDTVEFNKVIESSDRFIVHKLMQEPHQGDAPSAIFPVRDAIPSIRAQRGASPQHVRHCSRAEPNRP